QGRRAAVVVAVGGGVVTVGWQRWRWCRRWGERRVRESGGEGRIDRPWRLRMVAGDSHGGGVAAVVVLWWGWCSVVAVECRGGCGVMVATAG
nr:hypothetical protein [Tanacetum cinerariifolium]